MAARKDKTSWQFRLRCRGSSLALIGWYYCLCVNGFTVRYTYRKIQSPQLRPLYSVPSALTTPNDDVHLEEAVAVANDSIDDIVTISSSEPPQSSTFHLLSKKAKQWMEAEISYYQGSQQQEPYYPKIKKINRPSKKHLVAAGLEYQRRFPLCTVDDDDEYNRDHPADDNCKRSPLVLVANNVKDNWQSPFSVIHYPVRYLVFPSGETPNSATLFVTGGVAGPNHGAFCGSLSRDVEHWIWNNKLQDILVGTHLGGVGYKPEKAFGPVRPDPQDPHNNNNNNNNDDADFEGRPFARLVMEQEYAQRNGFMLRKLGFISMASNPYTRLYVVLKIWKKNELGNFGAAAVLWGKDEQGNIFVRKALDFGTQELDLASKLSFEAECDSDPDMLPGVDKWTRPSPSPGFDNLRDELESLTDADAGSISPSNNPDWCLTLPAADILYKTFYRKLNESPSAASDVGVKEGSVPDCYMNLQFFAWFANESNF